MRINIIIILYVIFMIWRWHKYRIHIDNFYTQVLKIIQFIQHALKVASIKPTDIIRFRQRIPLVDLFRKLMNINIFSVFHIIFRIPVIKTVNKNLVENCSLCPIRCLKTRHQFKIIILLTINLHSLLIIIQMYLSRYDFKIICTVFLRTINIFSVIIEKTNGFRLGH